MKTVKILIPTDPSEVTFRVEPAHEFEPIKGNVVCSDDEAFDRGVEERIARDLDNGNPWAWCTVKVIAQWAEFKGYAYLGCCSYESEAHFIEESGYYESMTGEAFQYLLQAIDASLPMARA